MAHTPRRVFLLSHMRAYTSLVGHLLGSHPEIDGYYELHRSYALPDDLDRALAQYAEHDAPKPGTRWFFDKLLHDDYALDLALPGLEDAVVLMALRPAAPTLNSILALFAQKPGIDLYATPQGATQYYVERLARLAAFAERYPGRVRYFDAPLVVSEPARLLPRLAGWLALSTPLSGRYRTFARTGVVGAGDSSAALAEGRILAPAGPQPEATLDPVLREQAEAAYRDCRARLIEHAGDAVLPA